MLKKLFVFLSFWLCANVSYSKNDTYLELLRDYDEALYKVRYEEDQKKLLIKLSKKATALVNQYPKDAAIKAWTGIIFAAESKYYTLNLYKANNRKNKAIQFLEQAKSMDANLQKGIIYTSLGLLYLEKSGDKFDQLSKEHLLQSIRLDPQGLESNFAYAKYLFKKKKYLETLKYLALATDAPLRSDRKRADKRIKFEVRQFVDKVKIQLEQKS